jgi:hypothetical protein
MSTVTEALLLEHKLCGVYFSPGWAGGVQRSNLVKEATVAMSARSSEPLAAGGAPARGIS